MPNAQMHSISNTIVKKSKATHATLCSLLDAGQVSCLISYVIIHVPALTQSAGFACQYACVSQGHPDRMQTVATRVFTGGS